MFRKDIRCALVAFSIESVRNRVSFANGSKSLAWILPRSRVNWIRLLSLASGR
jgi:hypothetical protein